MFDKSQIRINKGLDIDFPLSDFENEYVYFDKNNSYIVYLNNAIIGFYNIVKIEDDNLITLEYALLKSFRGLHFGRDFLNSIIENVSKQNSDISKITLMIKYDNIISKKVAKSDNFNIDFNLMEKLSDEISNFVPYSKDNEYYKNKKLCLQNQQNVV